MNYPKHNRYLIFEKVNRSTYTITDFVTEDEWSVPAYYARFLRALDGETNPYKLCANKLCADDVDMLLEDMEKEGFLDNTKGPMVLGIGSLLLPLWTPKITKWHRLFGAFWNKMLLLGWLPLFFAGVNVLLEHDWVWVDKGHGFLTGYLLGLGLGMLFHEFSHAFACIGYGSRNHFFEMGIMLHSFMPGAYVLIDYSEMKNRFKRAQIIAAGVECNMALCGVFLCCLKLGILDSYALILAAIDNLILALFNMALIEGIDGMRIFIETFASSDDFVERAKQLVLDKKSRRRLSRKGINGKARVVACYIIVFMQALWPLILVMSLLNILCCF